MFSAASNALTDDTRRTERVDLAEMSRLLDRYPTQGPRYTSYPTAVEFSDTFGLPELTDRLAQSRQDSPNERLSLYLHLPFCQHLCFYCGCNKVLTRKTEKGVEYLNYLLKEIDLWQEHLGGQRQIHQLHLGGGTPTFFDPGQLRQLVAEIGQRFQLATDGAHDYSIEIDPRTVDSEYIRSLATIGFNRISVGVQDFDPDVQRAVHRVQDADRITELVETARDTGIGSINFDLIYGLPKQSVASFRRTLEKVIECLPDRLSVYQYAHLPDRFPAQRRILGQDLPDRDTRMALQQLTIDVLSDAGYVYIGMDHFARPGDALVTAKRDGTLRRSFQGYTTHRDHELVGVGVSSIGEIGGCLYQNAKSLDAYYRILDEGVLPVERGVEVTTDDQIRHGVIMDVMCHGSVDKQRFECDNGIAFDDFFTESLSTLADMESDGLLQVSPKTIQITEKGRFMLRNVAMLFDRYRRSDHAVRLSRTV